MKGLCLGLLFIAVAIQTAVAGIEYKLLRDTRPQMQTPEYSLAEKQTVMSQARLMLDQVFAHRSLKIETFGASADHRPQFDAIEERLSELSTGDFHSSMAQVFFNLRDLHTHYRYPFPQNCFVNFLPMNLKEVVNENGTPVIAVASVPEKPEVLAALQSNLTINVGDVVLKIDGMAVNEIITRLEPISMGANPSAARKRAINMLTVNLASIYPIPQDNSSTVEVLSADGSVTTHTLPWLSKYNSECLESNAPASTEATGFVDFLDSQKIFRQHRVQHNKSGQAQNWTELNEPTVKYKIIRNSHGTFGVIKLESFYPEVLNIFAVLDNLKTLFRGAFSQTDGVIFDVRDNNGGYIRMAEMLLQLFTPADITPMNFRMRNSPAALHYIGLIEPESAWENSLKSLEGMPAEFTPSSTMNTPLMLGGLGQVYFGPVAFLTNGACYSSCDIVTAQVQDHGVATIFGEHETTGGGGANVEEHIEMVRRLRANAGPYVALPHKQSFSLSWRQALRVKAHAGEVLENIGTRSDRVLLPTLNDLRHDSVDQYSAISQHLKSRVSANPAKLAVRSERPDLLLNTQAQAFLRWNNITRLAFHDNALGQLGEVEVESSNLAGRMVPLPLSLTSRLTSGQLHIRGYFEGELVARVVIDYRIVLPSIVMEEGSSLNALELNPVSQLAMYHHLSQPVDGWQQVDGLLRIGLGMVYTGNVDTAASLFVTLPAEGAMSLRVEYEVDTEANCDFFDIGVRSNGNYTSITRGLSGKATATRLISLASYKGKAIEISLGFLSDELIVGGGVTVRRFEIVPAPVSPETGTSI